MPRSCSAKLGGAFPSTPLAAAAAAAATVVLTLLLTLPPAAAQPLGDDTIMHKLRQGMYAASAKWAEDHSGWMPSDPTQPCSWAGVGCDDAGHIMALKLSSRSPESLIEYWGQPYSFGDSSTATSSISSVQGPLLQELAQLRWLQSLELDMPRVRLMAGSVPPAWCRPGAFPRLRRLVLMLRSQASPLPDIQPGALPLLEHLEVSMVSLASTLPASWGDSPATLPSLHNLSLTLESMGQLPAGWARGFRQLEELHLEESIARRDPDATSALPPEWAEASTSFPRLCRLSLQRLTLLSSLPGSWIAGKGLPQLQELVLHETLLTGNLPAQLFSQRPLLHHLSLEGNALRGSLPDEWAACKVEVLRLSDNLLSGPAFPPAWLQPGSLPNLRLLDLSLNPDLHGTLPAHLAWPSLQSLHLRATGVKGSIPQSWCTAPFAAHMASLDVRQTRVQPALPPCFQSAMPELRYTWVGEPEIEANFTEVPAFDPATSKNKKLLAEAAARHHSRHQESAPAPAGRRAVLLAGAVVLAAVAGSAVLLRLRRRKATPLERPEQTTLLQLGIPATTTSSGEPDGIRIDLGPPDMRHARLAALLSVHLAQHPCSIRILPPAALPAAVAHQLQLATLSRRGGLDGTVAQHGSPDTGSNAADGFSARRWGLGTHSLQLTPDEVQFVIDAGGQPVVIGQGGHAVVLLGRLPGMMEVAVKVFELQPGMDSGAVWREAGMLRQCVHDHIIPLYGAAVQGPLLMLVTKLMCGGSLKQALQSAHLRPKLSWHARGRQVAMEVASALHYLHTELGIQHGDLKPSNVLLDGDWRAAIADLGLARFAEQSKLSHLGFTHSHAAPEQLLGQRCTTAADIYSLGVVLAELATQQLVYRRGDWRLPRVPDECSQAVRELICDCLAANPQCRPTAAQVLQRLQAEVPALPPPA